MIIVVNRIERTGHNIMDPVLPHNVHYCKDDYFHLEFLFEMI